jgi:hypothetical protein
MAPYIRTERRPTRSMVKMSGTQPRAKKVFRTPEMRETSFGSVTVESITEL